MSDFLRTVGVNVMKRDLDLLDFSFELQRRFEASTSGTARKQRGQFFTPKPVCRFMASLFSRPSEEFRLLDPGAGVGSLTAAICERFSGFKSARRLEVHLFENDPKIVDMLAENMAHCRRWMARAGHSFTYYIHAEDFVRVATDRFSKSRGLFKDEYDLGQFDAVITNPPYFKIRKNSTHARIMADIVHGQPNIYPLFLALGAHWLRPGGELVAITPRSFCNGLYFREFRRWFFERMSLQWLHVFESRTETFKDAGVLQESIISLTRRCAQQSPKVKITTSMGRDVQETPKCSEMPAETVIDKSAQDYVIRIPANGQDAQVMEAVESLPARFAETGLCVSTGPVVMFRAKDFLSEEINGRDTIPLLLPHNVKPFETIWPVRKSGKPIAFRICHDSRALALPTQNYVLLKRFSAKEERRRLTAGCFLRSQQNSDFVALENHLNYIYHGERELTEEEVYGIAAIFNSVLFDRYFRIISGSTQVNATELRAMHFPPLPLVAKIGRCVNRLVPLSSVRIESIVFKELEVAASVRKMLMGFFE